MSRAAEEIRPEALVDRLIELAKNLEVTNEEKLRNALQALNADAKAKRHEASMRTLANFFGQLFGAGLACGFLWLAYQMILRGESGYAVLLTGLPASSMAAIFVIRKMPDAKALGVLARQTQAMAANTPMVPGQAGPPAEAPAEAQPPAGGAAI